MPCRSCIRGCYSSTEIKAGSRGVSGAQKAYNGLARFADGTECRPYRAAALEHHINHARPARMTRAQPK